MGLISCAPPQTTISWRPSRINNVASPMAWEPLAQAADTVRFIPLRWNMHPRFMVTVEFIDWKMAPDPHIAVPFFSMIVRPAL